MLSKKLKIKKDHIRGIFSKVMLITTVNLSIFFVFFFRYTSLKLY